MAKKWLKIQQTRNTKNGRPVQVRDKRDGIRKNIAVFMSLSRAYVDKFVKFIHTIIDHPVRNKCIWMGKIEISIDNEYIYCHRATTQIYAYGLYALVAWRTVVAVLVCRKDQTLRSRRLKMPQVAFSSACAFQ